MNTTHPLVAIVDGSPYLERVSGVLVRHGFTLASVDSALEGLSSALADEIPFAIIYCVRGEHQSADHVQRTFDRFVGSHPSIRAIVCSSDFQVVQSLRLMQQMDGTAILFEPFDVEVLLEAVGTPSQSDARTLHGCV